MSGPHSLSLSLAHAISISWQINLRRTKAFGALYTTPSPPNEYASVTSRDDSVFCTTRIVAFWAAAIRAKMIFGNYLIVICGQIFIKIIRNWARRSMLLLFIRANLEPPIIYNSRMSQLRNLERKHWSGMRCWGREKPYLPVTSHIQNVSKFVKISTAECKYIYYIEP